MPARSPAGLIEYRTHYRWAVVAITVLFLVLFYRFFLLQIVRGDDYRQEQVESRQRSERVPARRGRILDRNGVVLAENVGSHDLVMYPSKVRNPEVTVELLRKLLTLDDEGDAHLRELLAVAMDNKQHYQKVVIRSDLVSEYCPFDSSRLSPLKRKEKTLWCAQCGRNYDPVAEGTRRCPHDRSHRLRWNEDETGAVCSHDKREYAAGTSCPHDGDVLRQRGWALECPICQRKFNNEVAIVKRDLYQMPGLDVQTSQRRVYPHRETVAHITGYMNRVNTQDKTRHPERSYDDSDRVGRAGTERAFEVELRGTWGRRNFLVDRPRKSGPVVERKDPDNPDIPVVDGKTIRLSIDIELQRQVTRAMRYHRSGGIAVVSVNTGEILALVSKPSFDPNLWSGRLPADVFRATQTNPYTPMLNKALTAYAPGSVYKLVTAVAGLRELLEFEHEEHCYGYYEYHGRRFRCHNRTGHGELNLLHSMSRSCDIYFYRLGERLGMDVLADYASRFFGFGQPTGIEIAEHTGLVPTKNWHRRTDRAWMPGFTLSTAVGQKDVRATPLQVARAYAAVANGGNLLDTHIVKQVEDSRGNVVRVTQPEGVGQIPITEENLAVLKEAFWRVVNDEHGTAFGARMDGMEVSGKTGTAQAPERKAGVSDEIAIWLKDDHAWFAGYAPSRKPEIAVAVFLDHGHSGGKAAAPVAMKIFKGYFSRRAQLGTAVEDESGKKLPNPIHTPVLGPGKSTGKKKKQPNVNTAPIDL